MKRGAIVHLSFAMRRSLTLALLVCSATAATAASAAEIDPRLSLYETARGRHLLSLLRPGKAAATSVPLLVERTPGATNAAWPAGSVPILGGRSATLELSVAALAAGELTKLAQRPDVLRVSLDGAPVVMPPPLSLTSTLISADDVWRTPREPSGHGLRGEGMTVCDIDSGIDVFHPAFFRADAGLVAWSDENKNGVLDPGVDQVLIGEQSVTLRSMNGIVVDRASGKPLFGSEAEAFDPVRDYLYADLNGDGRRNVGPAEGFVETTPGYGEPVFVLDDVNQSGTLDEGEKLVQLGSSKIKAFRLGQQIYRRGENLIDAPYDETMQHGIGASAVMVAGQTGYHTELGMAPEADLVMATDPTGDRQVQMTNFCIAEGARVVLHEYAPWTGFHLDGSSSLEKLIDKSSAEGIVHINPAGNLSTSKKGAVFSTVPGVQTVLPIENIKSGTRVMVLTLLHREPARELTFTLRSPSGTSFVLPSDIGQGFQDTFDATHDIFAFDQVSDRGTSMTMLYVFGKTSSATLELGAWQVDIDDSAAAAPPLEFFGFVSDELSGWGLGVHFPQFHSEDHLIGWPGTADHGTAIAAYTGHEYQAVLGDRAFYSGRGRRIDDVPLLVVSAPDNPVVPSRHEGKELSYLVYGGTSGASPHVAGSSALLVQADPSLDGDAVRAKLRAGAVVDAQTGAVPNEDFGHGKLDVYRALYGGDPANGSAPQLADQSVTLTAGVAQKVSIESSDADSDPLIFELDRDYDGVFDETLAAAELELSFAKRGSHVLKLRATDPSGRTDQALLRVTVQAPPGDDTDPGEFFIGGGGGCAVRGAGLPTGSWLMLAGLLLLGFGRRREALRDSQSN